MNFIADYLVYIVVKLFSLILMALPLRLAIRLGSLLGLVYFYLDHKHRNIVYTNLKVAFDKKKSHYQIKQLSRNVFRNLGKNLVEILRLPKFGLAYIKKYITVQNQHYIDQALEKKKGLVLLATHLGNWEFANATCGFLYGGRVSSYKVVVKEQKPEILNNLLNRYRQISGATTIALGIATREIIKNINAGGIVSIVMDQGVGEETDVFKFFTREMPLATGGMRMALKLDAEILLAFIIRTKGPYHKIFIEKIPNLQRTGNLESDTTANLSQAAAIFENYISQYPEQYLWFYKRWKYSRARSVLILNDGKAGHLRQTEAVLKQLKIALEKENFEIQTSYIEVKFKNNWPKFMILASSFFAHRRHCRGCLWCLKEFLEKGTYGKLSKAQADFVISCGASLAPVNYILTNENLGKSIVIMKPGSLSSKRFNLVIAPRHDHLAKAKNIFITDGAPNLIDEEYIRKQTEGLLKAEGPRLEAEGLKIGLLIGGDTKRFSLTKEIILTVCDEIKKIANEFNLDILFSSSRRTSQEIEKLLKDNLVDFPCTKLAIIANEKNLTEAVGGILGLSEIVVVSGESISMVSEAASSGKYTVVFKLKENRGISEGSRHQEFLNNLQRQGYIFLLEPEDLYPTIKKILQERPAIKILKDNLVIQEAIKSIL